MLSSKVRFPLLAWVVGLLAMTALPGWSLDTYYWNKGQRIPLVPSDQFVGVKLNAAGAGASRAMPRLRANYNSTQSTYLKRYNVAVLAAPTRSAGAVASLSAQVGKDTATQVLLPTYGQGPAMQVDLGQFVVRFRSTPSPAVLAELQRTYGFHVLEAYRWLPGAYLCAVNDLATQTGVSVANRLYENEQTIFSEPDLLRSMRARGLERSAAAPLASRLTPTDPLFPRQWHLNNTGRVGSVPGGTVGADVNAKRAWDLTTGGSIKIAILDDGCDLRHPDFQPAATKFAAMRDVLDNDGDPSPETGDMHGTACAGIAAAAQNGIGVSGIAPSCQLIPIRMLGMAMTVSIEAEAFTFATDNGADVISNSWGPTDGYGIVSPLPALTAAAIDNAVTNGRGGLGCVVTWASGNGSPIDSTDDDGYASNPQVLNVGASTWNDTKSSFSETGTSLDCVAPGGSGDDVPEHSILTTDNVGASGYTASNYTTGIDFSGTSAACPLAAGVAALALSVNPSLTSAQAMALLENTAVKIDSAAGAYDVNGHSNRYGYGRLDAYAAASAAVTGPRITVSVNTLNGPSVGGRLMDDTNAVVITSVLGGTSHTTNVWDGTPKTVLCDAGSTLSVSTTDSAGSTQSRWQIAPGQQNSVTVGSSDASLSFDYYNQVSASLSTQVPADAAPLTTGNEATVSYVSLGQAASVAVAATPVRAWVDAGSTLTYSARTAGTTADQRWLLFNDTPVNFTVTLANRELSPTYYQQIRPTITLSGATRNNPVTVTNHMLYGVSQATTPVDAYGTWSNWADVGSLIGFSERSKGSPTLVAQGTRSFTVTVGLNGTVLYDILAVAGMSGLTASGNDLPADGATDVVLTLTVRDSAGQALAGIAAARLTVTADNNDGLTITPPTTPSDANGQAIFRAHRSVDGPVVFRGNVDGEAVSNSVTVTFLRVMDITLPVPGLYLTTFPITVPNSSEQIANFNVAPKPTRLAGYNEDLMAYQAFDPAAPSSFFNIAPGKGWFLQTTVPGSIRLYGTWNTSASAQPTYQFDMAKAAYHLIGNPRPDQPLAFRMQDVRVYVNGVDQGDLRTQANWSIVDPFLWAFNGHTYELVMDPNMAGADGVRSQLEVFEGAFWRTRTANVRIVVAPGSVARAAAPTSASNFGFSLVAAAGEETSRVIVGAQSAALRSVRPPAPAGAAGGVMLEVLAADGSRAAADFVGGAVVNEATWRLKVSGSNGRQVTLSWPSLLRQLPAGYRARLIDPTSGRVVALNTTGSYVVNSDRELVLSVAPRAAGALAVQSFQPTTTRGGSTEFDVTLSAPAELIVQVASLTGRLVAQTAPVQGDGPTRIVWNGLDNAGRPLPAGVYNVTLIARNDQGDTVRAVRTVRLR
ncbi:MAG: S8 family serine peptidase [Armatimonadetes bacterium]|nr:S8 family serine peptidase [Armatimonadota bacterium]